MELLGKPLGEFLNIISQDILEKFYEQLIEIKILDEDEIPGESRELRIYGCIFLF